MQGSNIKRRIAHRVKVSAAAHSTETAPASGIASEDIRTFDQHVSELAVWDAANRAKDREDEALDSMRVSGGMTLDQFLERAR